MPLTMQYNYIVKPLAAQKIWSFYHHVARKYQHTFDEEDLIRNARQAVRSIYRIEQSLLRRKPIIKRWRQYYMANIGSWYYAYTIEDSTIVVHDACHKQNMHD